MPIKIQASWRFVSAGLLFILIIAGCAGGFVWWKWIASRTEEGNCIQGDIRHGEPLVGVVSENDPVKNGVQAPSDVDDGKVRRVTALHDLIFRWNQLIPAYRGEILLTKQWELAKEGLKLGPSEELIEFMNHLAVAGSGDIRRSLIEEIGSQLFVGTDAIAARKWVASVDERELREALCFQLGQQQAGGDLRECIEEFHFDVKSQSAVLTGFCVGLARKDPLGAVETFVELRPSTADFSGMIAVMKALPKNADFLAISAVIPPDEKQIARQTRAALLKSWAESLPADAAQYVLGNRGTVYADQMEVVASSWAAKSEAEAAEWVEALTQGSLRDHGLRGLVEHFKQSDPARAFEYAVSVGDAELKVKTATEVFQAWEKTDRAAAEAAWLKAARPE